MRDSLVAWLEALPLGIDVPCATEAMLDVLEGRITAAKLAIFLACMLKNVVRHGERRGTQILYVFSCGKYRRNSHALREMVRTHVCALFAMPALSSSAARSARLSPVERLEARCNTTEVTGIALAKMLRTMRAGAGGVAAHEFERAMDGGEYIGFRNGVYDLCGDRFTPNEQVHYSVLVSMSTGYDYVTAEACPQETVDKIKEFYRMLFSDPSDPSDANLAAAWRFSGSLLTAERKCAVAFVGGGDSGKTAFTNLMHRTLGEYSAGMFGFRFRRSAHCNERVRMSVYAEVGRKDVVRFECAGAALAFRATPVMHATAELSPSLARAIDAGSARALHFGSTFVHEGIDPARRLYARDSMLLARDAFDTWALAHFHLMLEARPLA